MTSFESLYDIFMTTITDYRLDNLYVVKEEAFYEYLKGFLVKGILEVEDKIFSSLDYEVQQIDIGTASEPIIVNRYFFTADLMPKEKLILVQMMAIYWYEKNTEDIVAISGRLGTRDAKDNNSQSDLKTKNARIKELRSDCYATIKDLQYDNLDSLPYWNEM